MAEKTHVHERYMVHPNEAYHYKMCLAALSRSQAYRSAIKTLDRKGLSKKSGALQSIVHHLLWKGGKGTLTAEDLVPLHVLLSELPQWPLVQEMKEYIDMIIRNAAYSPQAEENSSYIRKITERVEKSDRLF